METLHAILEFVWPMMAASAELMLGLWIFIILLIIGRGHILPSEKHIVIERAGQYKIDLAKGLNLAQPFIEAIVKKIGQAPHLLQDNAEYRFMVKDKNIASRKQPFYLLSITLKNGHIECAASQPTPEFVQAQPSPFTPDTIKINADGIEQLVYTAAQPWAIGLRILPAIH